MARASFKDISWREQETRIMYSLKTLVDVRHHCKGLDRRLFLLFLRQCGSCF
jgi:hypothetical protein